MINLFIGNTISFIGGLIDIIFDLQYNEKQKILKGNLLSTSCTIVSMFFLKAYDGMINGMVTLIRLITIYLKDKFQKHWNGLFIIFIFLYSLVFLNYAGIQTIILFISVMCSFIPKWLCKNVQHIRLGALGAYIFSITYNLMIHNYAIIVVQLITMITLIIAIIKWHKKEVTK